jgi:hypothetical protein
MEVTMESLHPLKQLLRTVSPQLLDADVVIVKSKSTIGPSDRTTEGIGAVSYGTLMGSYDQIQPSMRSKCMMGIHSSSWRHAP